LASDGRCGWSGAKLSNLAGAVVIILDRHGVVSAQIEDRGEPP
jgi:hypothetical protein